VKVLAFGVWRCLPSLWLFRPGLRFAKALAGCWFKARAGVLWCAALPGVV
jgi:hypothetical protein